MSPSWSSKPWQSHTCWEKCDTIRGRVLPQKGLVVATKVRTALMPFWLVLVVIGLLGGFAAGLFGVGGGIVIVPALIYWAGFTQHKATGTSLAVLLPPIGLAAALEVLPSRQRRCPRRRHPRNHDDDRRLGGSLRREPPQRAAPETVLRSFRVRPWDLSRLWSMQATRMVVDDLGSIAQPFWRCLPRAGTPEGSRHLIAVEQWDGVAPVAIPPPSAGLGSRHSLPPRRLPPHSLLVACGSNPPGLPGPRSLPRGSDQDRPCRPGR